MAIWLERRTCLQPHCWGCSLGCLSQDWSTAAGQAEDTPLQDRCSEAVGGVRVALLVGQGDGGLTGSTSASGRWLGERRVLSEGLHALGGWLAQRPLTVGKEQEEKQREASEPGGEAASSYIVSPAPSRTNLMWSSLQRKNARRVQPIKADVMKVGLEPRGNILPS